MKVAIYTCEFLAPHLTLELQRRGCELTCRKRNFANIDRYHDTTPDKPQLKVLLANIRNYSHINI